MRSRSAIRISASSSGASETEGESVTSWPAAPSVASMRDANMRSGARATTRATSRLKRASLAELAPHALWPAPHLDDLGAALGHLADDELTLDPLAVEELE